MDVTREQVLAYRVAAQQLDRSAKSARGLAVLDLGVQDGTGDQARLSIAARVDAIPGAESFGPGRQLALAWSVRGAPHVHRRRDLARLAGALYPLSEQDAQGRLNETGPSIARKGMAALDQYDTAVRAMRDVVRTPTAKGAVSTAVTRAIPMAMRRDCRACGTSHFSDSAMRASSLPAGLELDPRDAPPLLVPITGQRRVNAPDEDALRGLIRAYLDLFGPATTAQVADYLGVRTRDLEGLLPDDLTQVRVAGAKRPAWMAASRSTALSSPPSPRLTRLLGGFDPFLQARDRDLIVPDKAVRKALWPVLGRPGAVFVDGEVVGTWRPKASGKKLTLRVEEFAPLPPAVRDEVDAEAERVAAVKGLALAAVTR